MRDDGHFCKKLHKTIFIMSYFIIRILFAFIRTIIHVSTDSSFPQTPLKLPTVSQTPKYLIGQRKHRLLSVKCADAKRLGSWIKSPRLWPYYQPQSLRLRL